jgi:Ca2+-transporting ATPase
LKKIEHSLFLIRKIRRIELSSTHRTQPMSKGLSSQTAREKLLTYGPNELAHQPNFSGRRVWKEVITEPMILLLICCSILYFIIGETIESIVLFMMIGMILLISILQRTRSEKALEKLRELSAPRALVIRDGKPQRIPGREVVPHDVCILGAGDRVPADGKMLTATNLLVNESILTGESQPVLKSKEVNDQMAYAGTLVMSGAGLLYVTHTGEHTKFGQIGKSLKKIQKIQTPLQKAVKRIVRIMGAIALSVSIGLTLMIFLRNHNLVTALLSGLATSMALIPEEFPVILTIFLALGAWRLSRINVLTRDPAVIETLGSATVLCADKTGTITQNDMSLKFVADEEKSYDINEDTEPKLFEKLKEILHAADPHSFDPTERGITKSISKFGLKASQPNDIQPFDHGKNYSVVSYLNVDQTTHLIKGAPEKLLPYCHLNKTDRRVIETHLHNLTSNGLRVLLIMKSNIPGKFSLKKKNTFQFICLIGLEDPIRNEVPEAVKECRSAGINVIMMTGDHTNTASYIARQIGLNEREVLTGDELMRLDDQTLYKKLGNVQVLSRVEPAHKLRIVQLLQRRKHIVAMTGDGVNDAPSLKAAHIGIAMGNKGTDVAREAASLVLLDDNFASIVGGIRMGRRISDNIEKAMSYALAVHIPIIGLALSPVFSAQFPILLLPIHIVFMELVIDPVSSVAFETEKPEEGQMKKAPKKSAKKIFSNKNTLFGSLFEGLLILACVLFTYFFHDKAVDIGEIRAACFCTLITCNILLALSKLSRSVNIFEIIRSHNPLAKFILGVSFVIAMLCLYIPFLQDLFQFESLSERLLIQALGSSLIVLLIFELFKLCKHKRYSEVPFQEKSSLKKRK